MESTAVKSDWFRDESKPFFDEMFDSEGKYRPHYEEVYRYFTQIKNAGLAQSQQAMDRRMLEEGITLLRRATSIFALLSC